MHGSRKCYGELTQITVDKGLYKQQSPGIMFFSTAGAFSATSGTLTEEVKNHVDEEVGSH